MKDAACSRGHLSRRLSPYLWVLFSSSLVQLFQVWGFSDLSLSSLSSVSLLQRAKKRQARPEVLALQ